MKFWVMALREKEDGSRPTLREALEVGELHPTRRDCLAAAEGVLDGPEWQLVAVEVRLLTKLTPIPATDGGNEGKETGR